MNCVIVKGRLTKDPEARATSSGVNVASFTVAVDRKFKSEGQPATDFFNCIAWRNTADFICKYFKKGNAILLTGSLQSREWTDKNGEKHKSVEIVADSAEFCEGKKEDKEAAFPGIDDSDESVPF